MKLEKFDYQIGNKKQKRQFVMLGALCIALIITVVLYKTFASFSDSASYNIINSRVGSFANNRVELLRVNISKEDEGNEVNAILYQGGILSIDGTGEMKDFEGNDLIGEVLDAYIAANVEFTEDEQTFINDNKAIMNSLFDYAARSIIKDDNMLNTLIHNYFEHDVEKVELAKSLMNKVSQAGFSIDQIEVIGDVKNIGKNAFSLKGALNGNETLRKDIYTQVYVSNDYMCHPNASQSFNLFTVNANIEDVGDNAFLDLRVQNISIGETVTEIPINLFAWFNGGNLYFCNTASEPLHEKNASVTLAIPSLVQKIDNYAFYRYNGADLVIPDGVQEIGEYAFANYYGNDITIPDSVTILKDNAFRDFEGKITMSECPATKTFAPNATIFANETECTFN